MADTGETPTRDHKEQRYLSLDPRGEFDPRITTLPARLYKLFVQMRMMALSGDMPGILDIAWPALCECLGVRSPALQDHYAQVLEERHLIGFRKDDEAVVIARWTMPQLDVQGFKREPLPPRKRYPSDFRRARAGNDAGKDTAPSSAPDVPPVVPRQTMDTPPSADLQQFFGHNTAALSTLPQSPAESGAEEGVAAAESARNGETNLKKERKKETKACPPNPPAAESGQAAGQAGRAGGQASRFVSDTERKDVEQALLAQRVHAGNAHSLAYDPALNAGKVYAQIAALPDRAGADPPGLLVTALRQDLPLPPAYVERMQAQSQAQADQERHASEQLATEQKREARLRESDAQIARVLAANQAENHSAENEGGGGYAAL